MNVFEIKKGYFLVHDGKTAYPVYVDHERECLSCLCEPEEIYQSCQSRGLSPELTLRTMLRLLHCRRILRTGFRTNLSLVAGLVGVRGAGKTAGAVLLAILDWMLAGKKVYSNVPIEFAVRYRDSEIVLRSEELKKDVLLDINALESYYDCLLVIDEINAFIADSMRSNTVESVTLSWFIQQIRHRKISILWTNQDYHTTTNRVQWQTDIYIECRDDAIVEGYARTDNIGRKSHWSFHDMSGLWTGEIRKVNTPTQRGVVASFDERVVWLTPFWHCYNTDLSQKHEKVCLPTKEASNLLINPDKVAVFENRYGFKLDGVLQLVRCGLVELPRAELWEVMGIQGRSMTTSAGVLLRDLGVTSKQGTHDRIYVFPSQAEMIKRLSDMGINEKIVGGDE